MARPAWRGQHARLVPMQNRVPCLLEDRLRNERNGQEILCPSRQCDGVALGPPLPKPAHGDGQAELGFPPSRCSAPLCALFHVLAHVAPAIFLHDRGEKRRIVIRRIEADELGFELPLQYLDHLASNIAV
jgi:hypothetical protein